MKQSKQQQIDELNEEVKILKQARDLNKELYLSNEKYIASLKEEIFKQQCRLDACLYSMILMQNQIRAMASTPEVREAFEKKFKFDEDTKSWSEIRLAT